MDTSTATPLTSNPATEVEATPASSSGPAMSESDLADLISSFNDAASRLQLTQESLRAQVARLEDELRDTRSQLKRARELAALGEMAAGIAHEIRNPLGSIKLYANVLRQDLEDRPQQREVASKIARAVDGLNAVVGDVLAFAREIRPTRRATDLEDVTRRAIEACADGLVRNDVEVATEFAHRETRAAADPGLIQQALVNLVRNACDALTEAEAPRRIVVATGVRSALLEDGKRRPMCSIRVADSGPGIPDEVRARVFNPFFTTRATGTGLGLPIVHRIADAHEGRVLISNGKPDDPGSPQGAHVELLIPVEHEAASAATNTRTGEAA
jgi:signal transduction histidine kinase